MTMKPDILKISHKNFSDRNLSLPLVSVVVINLNQGHYLRDCLVSIINQSYWNIEIIVQDGQSNDDSLLTLESFPQVLLVSESDLSSSHAFAKAVDRANGKYLFFLNSSDGFYSNTWVENAVLKLEESTNASMVTGSVVGINPDSTVNSYSWPTKNRKVQRWKQNFYSWLFDGFGFTPISFGINASVLRSCSMPSEKFLPPGDPNSVDFFWYLSENFFSKGYISLRSNEIAAFVRLHTDRVDDSKYLSRQLSQLNSFILNFRKKLLLGRSRLNFVSSTGDELVDYQIRIWEIWFFFILAKIRNRFNQKSRNGME